MLKAGHPEGASFEVETARSGKDRLLRIAMAMLLTAASSACSSTADIAARRLHLVRDTASPAVTMGTGDYSRALGTVAPDQCCDDMNACEATMENQCVRAFEETTGDYTTAQWTTVVITVLGAAAGSIGVPALTSASASGNAVWISAFGGLSGAANALNLTSREVGMSADKIAAARTDFLQEYRPLMDEYHEARATNNFAQACAALRKVRSRCIDYLYAINPTDPVSEIDSE